MEKDHIKLKETLKVCNEHTAKHQHQTNKDY